MKKFFKKKTADEKKSPLKKAGKSDKLKENKSVNMDNEADEKEFESFSLK